MISAVEERMTSPTARGLAAAVGRAISDGAVQGGDVLPPIRTVAAELGLSPTTVSAAWTRLRHAGTVTTAGRRGTLVNARSAGPSRYRSALSAHVGGAAGRGVAATRGMADGTAGRGDGAGGDGMAPARELFRLDLSTGTPDPELLPDIAATLRRIEPPVEPSTYLDEPVLPELAELVRADWPFAAERLTVVNGAMDALQLIATVHLRFGDRVAVEEPGFPPLLDLLEATGAVPVPVALDDDGPQPAALAAAVDAGVRAVFIQPRGHNPTGASLTSERAAELARVLTDTDVLVVEDDSLGAISTSAPISLGCALAQRTLHVRSYSKSHGPDLRLAALAGPARLVDPIVERRFLGQGWTSRLLQRVLVDLLTDPHAVATVQRARAEYANRRDKITDHLARAGLRVGGKDGLNVWIPVIDENAALLLLATEGIGAAPGGPFTVGPGREQHLRVTISPIRSQFASIAGALADAARVGRRATVR